jgi:homoserine O-acetyltransferase
MPCRWTRGALAAVTVLGATLAWADAEPAPPMTFPGQAEADYIARDFRFESGQTLPEVRLHYTTLGSPRRDAGGHVVNAVLLLHGTTGTGKVFLAPSLAG